MRQQVSLDIMEFVEKQILPRYTEFGHSHGLRHVTRVIKNHDLGMSGPRAIHHITSGKILMADARLRKWFTAEQLHVMKEAVEDHRASSSRQPRSIYGKLVAEADRDLEPEEVFRRAVEFGLEHNPEMGKEEQWARFHAHILEKYSREGYIKLWIPNSPNEQYLKEIHNIIDDKDKLRRTFDTLYGQLTHGTI